MMTSIRRKREPIEQETGHPLVDADRRASWTARSCGGADDAEEEDLADVLVGAIEPG